MFEWVQKRNLHKPQVFGSYFGSFYIFFIFLKFFGLFLSPSEEVEGVLFAGLRRWGVTKSGANPQAIRAKGVSFSVIV